MKNQAEALKKKFGSAIASENNENEIVCIPGLRGRDPREISLKNLANIIEARMSEIIEHIYYEIKNSGFEKELIGGIVVTGGGSQMRHITQLFEFITGMDCRIGYPNEHLYKAPNEDVVKPTYSTGVGLVMKGFDNGSKPTSDDLIKKQQGESRKGAVKFLDNIKAWFENEEE